MIHHPEILEQWYNEITKRFPNMPKEDRILIATAIYNELDYIVLMGELRPGGLFERWKIPLPKNEPTGIMNIDLLKFFE